MSSCGSNAGMEIGDVYATAWPFWPTIKSSVTHCSTPTVQLTHQPDAASNIIHILRFCLVYRLAAPDFVINCAVVKMVM